MAQTNTGVRFRFKFIPSTNISTAQQGQKEQRPDLTTAISRNISEKTVAHTRRCESWTANKVALAKAMRRRGDRQHDIAAYFGVNGGRIAEMDKKWPEVQPSKELLPPVGPYDIPCLIEAKNTANRRMATARNDIKDACAELEMCFHPYEMPPIVSALRKLMRCAELLERQI